MQIARQSSLFNIDEFDKEVFYFGRVSDLIIKPIKRSLAISYVIRYHYLHRVAPCSQAFGLFLPNGDLVGVVCYGSPASPSLINGVCGKDESKNVIELTRLWVHDCMPKNCASYLIGNTIPFVFKEIIVSFADTEQDHIGIVYQATNWIYTGLSAKRTNWVIDGLAAKHGKTISDKYSSEYLRGEYGERFFLQDRSRKHRYVYFNANKKRKKELIEKLKYNILDYPKCN